LIPTALAYIFFGIGLRTLTASTVATITLLEPVVASAFGVLLLNEVLSSTQAVGIVLVMLGLLILGIKSSKRKEQVVN
jgi:DME family drug/metabolite transporter